MSAPAPVSPSSGEARGPIAASPPALGAASVDPIEALRAAFPSSMAASALSAMRVARVDESEIELVGPAGAIGMFRTRADDVSRALSGALGRRVRAVLTADSGAPEGGAGGEPERRALLTLDEARAHPLVAAAQRAFNAEIQRVDPIPKRSPPERQMSDRSRSDRFRPDPSLHDQSIPPESNP